jgi:hypothetical protein
MSAGRELLWSRLREAALVQGDVPAADDQASPWYVRLMLGIAGWIGALFLLAFVGAGLVFITRSGGAQVAVGVLACGAATMTFRAAPKNDFLGQFALAVSLAGQVLLAMGIGALLHPWEQSWQPVAALIAIQQAVLFLLVPNFIHRVWTAGSASYAALVALGEAFIHFAPALAAAAFIALWLREFQHPRQASLVRAAGYGLAITTLLCAVLSASLMQALVWGAGFDASGVRAPWWWVNGAAAGAVLVAGVIALLRREGLSLASGPARSALAGALVIAAASIKAPGLAPATAILVVGYANGNRVLAGLGVLALLAYLSHYYYALQATLLEKSMLLAGAGVAVLAARFALQHWWPEAERA